MFALSPKLWLAIGALALLLALAGGVWVALDAAHDRGYAAAQQTHQQAATEAAEAVARAAATSRPDPSSSALPERLRGDW